MGRRTAGGARVVPAAEDGAKGKREEAAEESDDDDVGPRPASDPSEGAPAKKRRVLPFENVYLEALPSAQMSVPSLRGLPRSRRSPQSKC